MSSKFAISLLGLTVAAAVAAVGALFPLRVGE